MDTDTSLHEPYLLIEVEFGIIWSIVECVELLGLTVG